MTNRFRLGVAAHAKLAGLGVAAAVTLAVSTVPGVALAAEGEGTPATPAATAGESVEETDVRVTDAKADGGAAELTDPASLAHADASAASADPGATEGATGQERAVAPVSDGGSGQAEEAAPPAGNEAKDPSGELVAASPSLGPEEGQAGSAGASTSDVPTGGTGAREEAAKPEGADLASAPAPPEAHAPAAPSAASGTLPASEPPAPAPEEVSSETVSLVSAAQAAQPSHGINVFRMYNPNSGEHFYTSNEYEALYLFGVGWQWEGISYEADAQTGTAVYRLYNPNAGNHFYTTNKYESDHVAAAGWTYEGIAWYAVGNTLLYRLYNPNDGTHVYTTSTAERDYVRNAGWAYEGTAWSVLNGYIPLANLASHMVYSRAYGSYQRYWIASDGQFARNRLVHASENQLGYDVYATGSGALARNRHVAVSQVVYDAANDGRLSIATNLRGIDIASYQAGMNTAAVDADFVIVKATQGTGYTNPYMRAQADAAYNSGKLLGFYHYASTDFGGGDPVAEADYFVQQVGSYAGRALLVLDWEGIENSHFGSNDAAYVKAFLDRVYQRTGVRGVVYMSRNAANSRDYSSVANSGYGLWVAQYLYYNGMNEYPNYVTSPMTTHSSTTWSRGMTGAWSSPALYQYTSKGHVGGYSGELDLNVFYQDSGAWARMASRA